MPGSGFVLRGLCSACTVRCADQPCEAFLHSMANILSAWRRSRLREEELQLKLRLRQLQAPQAVQSCLKAVVPP